MAALEPSDVAPPRRVERGYSEVDVRKALLYLLAHVEQGIAPPTPWVVAHKKLGVPAMYEPVRACVLSFRVRTCGGDAHPGAALRHPCRGARARAFRACGPAPTRVLKRSLLSGTPAHSSRMRGRRSRRCQPTRGGRDRRVRAAAKGWREEQYQDLQRRRGGDSCLLLQHGCGDDRGSRVLTLP